MEIEEIVKIIIFVLVLAVSFGFAIYFFKGNDGGLFGALKDLLRFGR